MALPLAAQGQTVLVDTVESRCSRYYYSEWYDQCDHYIHPPDYLFGVPETFSLETPGGYGDDGRWGLYTSDYTVRPLEILGVAVMVSLNDMPRLTPTGDGNYSVNYLDSVRLPEYVALYQMSDKDSGEVYLIDSVRWDTVAARVMMLPRNMYAVAGDSGGYEQCLVYEARFERPVTVDSFFYIGGTFRSNTMEGEEYVYSYVPTVYQTFVEDADVDGCLYCQPQRRLFRNDVYIGGRFMGEWLIQNDKYGMGYTAGPFFPVIRY